LIVERTRKLRIENDKASSLLMPTAHIRESLVRCYVRISKVLDKRLVDEGATLVARPEDVAQARIYLRKIAGVIKNEHKALKEDWELPFV
jgi:hypothetical protein